LDINTGKLGDADGGTKGIKEWKKGVRIKEMIPGSFTIVLYFV
jgi:hypothetical protein